ncbi:MAG: rhomboid family intramembrane serine protease [Akkermansiaceae bacterium]|nr:rhomboid family intramembrane serine protease [Akkermansiaceae bacterium]
MPPSSTTAADAPEYVPLGRYPAVGAAFEEALVILSMGLGCQIDEHPEGGYVLLAEPAEAGRIETELTCYREEQAVPPPPPPPPTPDHGSGSVMTALWILALAWSFWMQDQSPAWTARGVSSPESIFGEGEWWRPFTALFLHADLGHLLSNIVSGAFIGTWVCRSLGPVRGWLLILLAGTAGNLLNAAARRGEAFASLGASTAVFGALGILTGIALLEAMHDRSRRGRFRYLLPIGGGIAMLSMWGASPDPRTDVSGHVCGFLCGLLLGAAPAWKAFKMPDWRTLD